MLDDLGIYLGHINRSVAATLRLHLHRIAHHWREPSAPRPSASSLEDGGGASVLLAPSRGKGVASAPGPWSPPLARSPASLHQAARKSAVAAMFRAGELSRITFAALPITS